MLLFTSNSGCVLTVPSGLSATFECAIVQMGTAQTTVSAGGGVAIFNRQGFTKTAGQFAVMSLLATTSDNYVLAGDGA